MATQAQHRLTEVVLATDLRRGSSGTYGHSAAQEASCLPPPCNLALALALTLAPSPNPNPNPNPNQVKTWAIFDRSIALPVSGVIALSAVAIVAFYVRANDDVFRRLDPVRRRPLPILIHTPTPALTRTWP